MQNSSGCDAIYLSIDLDVFPASEATTSARAELRRVTGYSRCLYELVT